MSNLIKFSVVILASFCLLEVHSLEVSVFYESLCPDSIRFITKQLYPVWRELGDYFDVKFYPYGNAEMSNATGSWKFECQHGEWECYGNEIQACALALALDEEDSQGSSVEFVNCAMSSEDPSEDRFLRQCAQKAQLLWPSIEACYAVGLGDKLHADVGYVTETFKPPIRYVPTVVFDGEWTQAMQDKGEFHFRETLCGLLTETPSECL